MARHHEGPHKYERVEVGTKGWVVYKCMLPGCSHYLPSAKLIVNKVSICWGICNNTAIYTQEDYEKKLKHPMCDNCREVRRKQREELSKIA